MKQTSRQAQNATGNDFTDKSQAYLHVHAHALFSSLGRLARSPFTTSMTIVVMAIAISLAAGFYLLVINMQQLTGDLEATNQISLFLKANISDTEGKKLADKIQSESNIETVEFISKKQALIDFKQHSGFGEVLKMLDSNPLPAVIQVLPKNTLDDILSVKKLKTRLTQYHQVDFAKMDMQWIKRLHSIMQIMQRSVFLLSILLGFAVFLITGNTIRLELQNRKDEVLVAKLVGATHSFIQRPFLYTGFWLGFLSGILAWILVTIMLFVLQGPIGNLSSQYEGSFEVLYLSFNETILLLGIASLLGIFGSWIVLRSQIQQIKPE